MNRFSQQSWHETNGTITKADYENYVSNINALIAFMGRKPDSFLINFQTLLDKGLNYVIWNEKVQDTKNLTKKTIIEISYNLIHGSEESYASLAVSEGDNNAAGIDQELTITQDPVPVLSRLIKEYLGGQEDAESNTLNVVKDIEKRIEKLSPQTPTDEKIEVWKILQVIPDGKKEELIIKFKERVKAFRHKRLVKRAGWKTKEDGFTEEYISELIDETLFNINMALEDPDADILKTYDYNLARLFEGALDWAVAQMGEDGFTERLPQKLERALYSAVFAVGGLYNNSESTDLSDEIIAKIEKDVEKEMRNAFSKYFQENSDQRIDPGINDSVNIYKELSSRIEKLTPSSPPNQIIDTYNTIKSFPDKEKRNELLEKLKNKTKTAFHRALRKYARFLTEDEVRERARKECEETGKTAEELLIEYTEKQNRFSKRIWAQGNNIRLLYQEITKVLGNPDDSYYAGSRPNNPIFICSWDIEDWTIYVHFGVDKVGVEDALNHPEAFRTPFSFTDEYSYEEINRIISDIKSLKIQLENKTPSEEDINELSEEELDINSSNRFSKKKWAQQLDYDTNIFLNKIKDVRNFLENEGYEIFYESSKENKEENYKLAQIGIKEPHIIFQIYLLPENAPEPTIEIKMLDMGYKISPTTALYHTVLIGYDWDITKEISKGLQKFDHLIEEKFNENRGNYVPNLAEDIIKRINESKPLKPDQKIDFYKEIKELGDPAQQEMIMNILKKAKINRFNKENWNKFSQEKVSLEKALIEAVRKYDPDEIMDLLSQGANPLVSPENKSKTFTAINYAAQAKDPQILEYFAGEGYTLDQLPDGGATALANMMHLNRDKNFQYVIENNQVDPSKFPDDYYNPLGYAIMHGDFDSAEYLIDKLNLDINTKIKGVPVLIRAIEYLEDRKIAELNTEAAEDFIITLIKKGAHVDERVEKYLEKIGKEELIWEAEEQITFDDLPKEEQERILQENKEKQEQYKLKRRMDQVKEKEKREEQQIIEDIKNKNRNNQEDLDEKEKIKFDSKMQLLMKKLEQPKLTHNQIIDVYNEIKALPDDHPHKGNLMNMFMNKVKNAYKKGLIKYSEFKKYQKIFSLRGRINFKKKLK